MSLDLQHPEVARDFHKGNFVVHKSEREFSALAIDQAHEQNNAIIKGDGGAIGLTEDPAALRRWMVAGPEVCRLIAEYEAVSGTKDATISKKHHEDNESAQHTFFEKVNRLTVVLEEMGNPFKEESADLLVLDTKDIAEPTMAEMIKTHQKRGREQFNSFIGALGSGNSLHGGSTFYQPIKKNKITFFKQDQAGGMSKEKVIKEDCHLFSRLFISCQSRECDLHEFFQHENQSFAASLSDGGKLHTCQKSHLVDILENEVAMPDAEPKADVIILDGSALINALPPHSSKTIENYAREDILPRINSYGNKFKLSHVVFDTYQQCSLKAEARIRHGKGTR